MKLLRDIIKNIAVVAFIAVLALAFFAVFFRYALNNSIVWAEEAIRYLCIWVFFLTMFESTRTGAHIALDLIPGFMHGKAKLCLNIAIELVNLAFDGVMIYCGLQLAAVNMAQKSSALLIPYGYVYLAIPVGAVLMALFSLQRIVNFLQERPGREVTTQ